MLNGCISWELAPFTAYTLPFYITHTLCMYWNSNHSTSICVCSLFTKLSATRPAMRRTNDWAMNQKDWEDPRTQNFGHLNPLTPNDLYISRTTPLTSKRCILYIYSTNVGTEYFKHALYCFFFSSKCRLFHNANLFGSCIIHILYTECAEIKKKIIPAPKG